MARLTSLTRLKTQQQSLLLPRPMEGPALAWPLQLQPPVALQPLERSSERVILTTRSSGRMTMVSMRTMTMTMTAAAPISKVASRWMI